MTGCIADLCIDTDGVFKITRKVSVDYIMMRYKPGEDSRTWKEELLWMENNQAYQLLRLARYASEYGLPSPEDERITLGSDGRVWDGHHRLYVATVLGIKEVEVDEWREIS